MAENALYITLLPCFLGFIVALTVARQQQGHQMVKIAIKLLLPSSLPTHYMLLLLPNNYIEGNNNTTKGVKKEGLWRQLYRN